MQDATDLALEKMSLVELQELQTAIHVAIRSEIRKRNERLSSRPVTVEPPPKPKLDLERERDAWLAKRRGAA
ncbi:MAG: hypothetical protein AB7O57_01740 [Hyphomicrobiaceae bacterium]